MVHSGQTAHRCGWGDGCGAALTGDVAAIDQWDSSRVQPGVASPCSSVIWVPGQVAAECNLQRYRTRPRCDQEQLLSSRWQEAGGRRESLRAGRGCETESSREDP